jgi:1-acyl-sn-glycerol-3-phosphate acyltransferase
VVSNHIEMADIPLLVTVIPRKLTFLGKEELWRGPVLKVLADWYGAFPVYKGTTDTRALRRCLDALKRGQALVIFPEGTRSLQSASLLPGQPGAALVALRSSAPILPVAITGTERTGGIRWLWGRPRLRVNIGPVFTITRERDRPLKEQLASGTRAIMGRIADLLPPSRRGVYGS